MASLFSRGLGNPTASSIVRLSSRPSKLRRLQPLCAFLSARAFLPLASSGQAPNAPSIVYASLLLRSRPPGPQKPGGHFRSLFRSPVSFDGHEAMHQVFHRSVLRVCVGIDRSRLDDVDRDSAGPEITRQPSGQTLQGGLAHGIGGRARDGHPVAIDRAASPYCDERITTLAHYDAGGGAYLTHQWK